MSPFDSSQSSVKKATISTSSLNAIMELPVGPLVSTTPAAFPSRQSLNGKYTAIVPLQKDHSDVLFKHLGGAENGDRWTYMLGGPFAEIEQWKPVVGNWCEVQDTIFFSIFSRPIDDPESEPAGMISYLNIVPSHRRIEIGSVILGEELKGTRQATEAFYLFIKHAFEDLGYLRVEWKANKLNQPSLTAAERLGFTFEGIFRSHMILKGRRRDIAWFSITDEEWPIVKQAFEQWLDETNFDSDGKQIRDLRAVRSALRT